MSENGIMDQCEHRKKDNWISDFKDYKTDSSKKYKSI